MDQARYPGRNRTVRRLLVAVAVLVLSASFGVVALADDHQAGQSQMAAGTTTLTIDYTCATGCSGTFTHTYSITLDCEGRFTGTGSYTADPTVTEQISGRIGGDRGDAAMRFTFVTLYSGTNAGYSVEVKGTIDPTTGAIKGEALSNANQTFTVTGTRGDMVATSTCGEDTEDTEDED